MKKACLIATIACFSALFTGCGSSSSDNGNGTLPVEDQTLDSFCANNPSQCQATQQCQNQTYQQPYQNQNNGSLFGNSTNNGYGYSNAPQTSCYPVNQNGYYPESAFGFAGGACSCPSGTIPYVAEGDSYLNMNGRDLLQNNGFRCLHRETIVVTGWAATVTFSSGHKRSRRNGRKDRRRWKNHTFDLEITQRGQNIDRIVPAQGNCYQELPVGCSLHAPYRSCAGVNRPGKPQAVCVAVNGGRTGQGICIHQSVPTR